MNQFLCPACLKPLKLEGGEYTCPRCGPFTPQPPIIVPPGTVSNNTTYQWNGRELVPSSSKFWVGAEAPRPSGIPEPGEPLKEWLWGAEKAEKRPYLCPVCGGRGTVAEEFYEPLPCGVVPMSTAVPSRVPCRSCRGAGYIVV